MDADQSNSRVLTSRRSSQSGFRRRLPPDLGSVFVRLRVVQLDIHGDAARTRQYTPTVTPGSTNCSSAGGLSRAGCWAHVLRKFFDVQPATGSAFAKEAEPVDPD